VDFLEFFLNVLVHFETFVIDFIDQIFIVDAFVFPFLERQLLFVLQVGVDAEQVLLHGLHDFVSEFHLPFTADQLFVVVPFPG
jgi:hypothetical protein